MQEDFARFCDLHSWYKHIPLEGKDFYAYRSKGQEPRNGVCPQVEDFDGMHWHFSTWKPENVKSYKVRFGPFLRGIECWYNDEPVVRGLDIIIRIAGDQFTRWIAEKYPHLSHIDWTTGYLEREHSKAVTEIYQTECAKYWKDLCAAVGVESILNAKKMI